MNTNLNELQRALLIKIAIELKRLGWKPNTQSNNIDIAQGFVSMYKEYTVSYNLQIGVESGVDITLAPEGDQNYVKYDKQLSLWTDDLGGKDYTDDGDSAESLS